jgi:hypothetical protein
MIPVGRTNMHSGYIGIYLHHEVERERSRHLVGADDELGEELVR